MRLYLDTNIFLDAILPNRRYQEEARLLMNRIAIEDAAAFTASFSIATISYFLQKTVKENAAVILEQLLQQIGLISLEKEDFIQALTLGFTDLEDAYQYVAATKAGSIDYIVTQNVKDFRQSAIAVMRPREVLKVL